MTVKVSRPSIDIRGTLDELNKPSGIAGNAMLAAETPQEQFNLIGAGRKNLIINGGFDVWQRGESFTPSTSQTYTADRWFSYRSSTSLSTITKRTDAVGVPFVNYIRVDNSIDANTTWYQLTQRIEDYQHLLNKTLTLSFYIRASQAVSDMRIATNAALTSSLFAVTTSWVKHEITLSLSTGTMSSDGYLEVKLDKTTSELPANTTIDVAQVQLELGSVATPFEHRSYGEELALCQRYYQTLDFSRSMLGVLHRATSAGSGFPYGSFSLLAPMRAYPTMTAPGSWGTAADQAGEPYLYESGITNVTFRGANGAITAGGSQWIRGGFCNFDAEL